MEQHEQRGVGLYRWFCGAVLTPIAEMISSAKRARPPIRLPTQDFPIATRIWFHASSVGELESMVPLMSRALAQGIKVVITHFSASAEKHAVRIGAELSREWNPVEFVGYGPWEGQWRDWIERIKPSLFLTARYESWPELWMSLAAARIPLFVISAKARRNFYVAEKIIRRLRGELPDLTLIVADARDIEPFKQLFPKADVVLGGDPRWERVKIRSATAQPRAKALIEQLGVEPKSCGVLGQVWLKDLEFFGDALAKLTCPIWLTPHDVTPENIANIEAFLVQNHIDYLKTSELAEGAATAGKVVFVDEMGFLLELYRIAAWVYVGGGFSKGVHSTIEPAIHCVPIACAQKNVDKFTEIVQLRESGQVTVCYSRDELLQWLNARTESAVSNDVRERWQAETDARIGATEPIFARIADKLKHLGH